MFVTSFLHFISCLERKLGVAWFCKFKVFILKRMLTCKDFVDNDISNIVCTNLDRFNKCDKAIQRLSNSGERIFCISPRSLVFCVLHKNIEMLKCVKNMGYPLEMIKCSDNYGLVVKKRMEKIIQMV